MEKKRIFKLKNQIKHYDWGSPEWIPRLLGAENPDASPWAELWMGVHPEGPSEVADEGLSLPELISRDPAGSLGAETSKRFGTLPFLFKVLAAGKPLSIQAHPSLPQAQAGFARENRQGIPLTARNRNYKDPNHKPEILCALGDFTAMAGFREAPEIAKRLEALADYFPKTALKTLLKPLAEENLKEFFEKIFSAEVKTALKNLRIGGDLFKTRPEYEDEWKTMGTFAELYPEDPGILSPLYLNLLTLRENQGIYIPPGTLHAYISGLGVELMANSDNVLRGGLTSKHVDLAELLEILDFRPFRPEILAPRGSVFPTPCEEFALLTRTPDISGKPPRSGGGGIDLFKEKTKPGPYIILVTQGIAVLTSKGLETCTLGPGESAFIPAMDAPDDLRISGEYRLYAATVGEGGR
jgi:mannose-6-phosphate isomerase